MTGKAPAGSAEPPFPGGTSHHPGFRRTFAPGRLTLGLFFPIESFAGVFPMMHRQEALARRAEDLGFAALWVRDVPLHVPGFNDVGQIHDPWVWLGYIAAHTERIALATGGIALPLRHPLHVAKAAASVDQLSRGRFLLGGAAGDRPEESPVFQVPRAERGERFRESVGFLTRALEERFPDFQSPLGTMRGADLIPKPYAGHVPFLVVGHSRQTLEWIAEHADAWVQYARDAPLQARIAADWRQAVEQRVPGVFKPFAQSLAIDLSEDPDAEPERLYIDFYGRRVALGYRLGRNRLLEHLGQLQAAGVHHVGLNLRFGRRPAEEAVEELGAAVLPRFPAHAAAEPDG